MTLTRAAEYIEARSEQQCITRMGHTPAVWYTGGSSHNDDRLVAIVDGADIRVSDGICTETYTGPRTRRAIDAYVRDWLAALWEDDDIAS